MPRDRAPSIFVVLALVLAVFLTTAAPPPSSATVPQTINVDGVNDFLPANLVQNDGGDTQTQNWCPSDMAVESPFDLGAVYITNDANYLYVGVAYDPDCFRTMAPEMQFGMAIDRDPG